MDNLFDWGASFSEFRQQQKLTFIYLNQTPRSASIYYFG